jgi:CubicO group peptidase (beta-lactamase class C family)
MKRTKRGPALLLAAALAVTAAPFAGADGIPSKEFLGALSDPEPAVRERAAIALGAGGSAAIEPLVAALADADAFVAGAAASSLARIGKESVPALVKALDAKPEAVRAGAAIALGKLGASAQPAAPALVRALADKDAYVRWCAANALAASGLASEPVLAALRESIHDADEDVRRGAALALERLDRAAWLRAPSWDATLATIERLTPLLMSELHVPGVSIAIVRDRKVAWTRVWGVADAGATGTAAPVTDTTLFEAASMTKPVFAATVLKLAEEGRLDLDAAVPDVGTLPSQPERSKITPRMVLSHTSGLPNWRKGGEERDGPLPMLAAPGSKFGYSGEAIFALQRHVEQLTGEPIEEYARRTLFVPLGMEHTSYVWTPALDARLATGHKADGTRLERARYRHANGAYSLVTTASDYARFLAALLAPESAAPHGLSGASVAAMLKHQVRADAREPIDRPGRAKGREVFWGLGWGLNTTAEGDVVYHSGANRTGFRSYCQFSPGRGTGIVVMTNGLGGGELWTRLIAAIGDL